jgi:sugar transferase (PEP-CTERM system associated)
MIRLFHVYFPSRTLLLALSEASLLVVALVAANFAWLGRDAELTLMYERGLSKAALATLVCMLCMYYYDLYDSLALSSSRHALTRIVQVLGTACLVLAVVYYTWPAVQLRPGVLVLWILLAGVLLAFWRRLFFALSRSVRLRQRTILLGEGPLASSLAAEIRNRPELGVNVLGYVQKYPGGPTVSLNGLPRLGHVGQLCELIESQRVDRIILTMGDRRGGFPLEELLNFKTRGIVIEDAADVYEAITGKLPIQSLRPSWLLLSDGFRVSPSMLLYKRVFSILLSLFGLALSLPVMLVVAIAIRVDSRGPVIFRQRRIGKAGRPFTLYKFRSMRHDPQAEQNPEPAEKNDYRITRVGRWLRRCRLDELPQLYNILRGDMYFIGPRPFVPNTEETLASQIPYYNQRWSIKPGATGWAQVQAGYCSSFEENFEKLSYDLFYIKNLSVGLDALIVFQTIKILLLGRGAR